MLILNDEIAFEQTQNKMNGYLWGGEMMGAEQEDAFTLPGSVLFACDHNSVRSPMAEALMKARHGTSIYVQSASAKDTLDIDGFSVAALAEQEVDVSRHRARSFDDMENWGEEVGSYDLIITLSPAAHRRALEYTRCFALEVEYWPTYDPSAVEGNREQRLDAYRKTRDQLAERIRNRFG